MAEVKKEASVRKPEKFILDATAGHRMMWFDKNNPYTIYMDIDDDEELRSRYDSAEKQARKPHYYQPWLPLNPTLKGDFRKLDFPDNSFYLIVFDPPHLTWLGKNSIFKKKFGQLETETWPDDIKKGAKELWRVLKPYGVLVFKWNTHDIPYQKVLKLFPEMPLFGQISAGSSSKFQKIRGHTCWFTFLKMPKEEG